MYNLPRIIQTRDDFNAALAAARSGAASRQVVANHFAGLIESAKSYVFDCELKEGQEPSGGMPEYCVTEPNETNPKRVQLKLDHDLSRITQLGYTLNEVRAIINELESK